MDDEIIIEEGEISDLELEDGILISREEFDRLVEKVKELNERVLH